MIKKFVVDPRTDTSAMYEQIRSMEAVLTGLDAGAIPDKDSCTAEEMKGYALSLIQGQRGMLGSVRPDSWSVAADDEMMDSEARVDFVFLPTYIAAATLSRLWLDHNDLVKKIPWYTLVLGRGLDFCALRKLDGHGYEADQGKAAALRILALGKVPLLLSRERLSIRLHRVLAGLVSGMRERLPTGPVRNTWGADFTAQWTEALEILDLRNGKDWMEVRRQL